MLFKYYSDFDTIRIIHKTTKSLVLLKNMNSYGSMSALEEITDIVKKMDTAAPLPALQRVGKLLKANPNIIVQACNVIERTFMNVYCIS